MQGAAGEDYQGRLAGKVEASLAVLEREVASLVTGEDWVRFLGFQARLHSYSTNNVLLIAAQHAIAHAEGRVSASFPTWVAGFKTWRALGRTVERGQQGYAVLAPVHQVRRSAIDGAGNERPLGSGDVANPDETEHRVGTIRGFKVEYVFDVSQTSGAELPVPPTPRLLEGSGPPGLREAVVELIQRQGFSVGFAPNADALDGANGATRWDIRTVTVRSDMADSAQVKTLIHEAAHVLLHEEPPGRYLPRPVKEVEAESVAFVVAAVHGMATDDYSFPYVASWAGASASRAVAETQSRVASAAKAIIAVSPADHGTGGKAPGAEAAIAAARQRERPAAGRAEFGVGAPLGPRFPVRSGPELS
jgi:hypothetical protein